jgi:hypothetical protein
MTWLTVCWVCWPADRRGTALCTHPPMATTLNGSGLYLGMEAVDPDRAAEEDDPDGLAGVGGPASVAGGIAGPVSSR